MNQRRSYHIATPATPARCEVGAAVPTLLLLMADAYLQRDPDQPSAYWSHRHDPLYRLGANMRSCHERSEFLPGKLEDSQLAGYRLDDDMLTLGTLALRDLTDDQRRVVVEANDAAAYSQTSIHALAGNRRPVGVATESTHLPVDYALPFAGPAALIFDEESAHLVGVEFDIRSTVE